MTAKDAGRPLQKIRFKGIVLAVQPRTRVWRYVVDNRSHYYLGYNLFLSGNARGIEKRFSVAISEKQQQKLELRAGDTIKGTAWQKKHEKGEFADFYRAGSLKLLGRKIDSPDSCGPPWTTVSPELETYKQRGARVLCKSRWKSKCFTCVWANMANVEIQWDFDRDIKKYRFESFCYGPKSCRYYRVGRAPLVPYRNRGSFPDDGAFDEMMTEHRDDDE